MTSPGVLQNTTPGSPAWIRPRLWTRAAPGPKHHDCVMWAHHPPLPGRVLRIDHFDSGQPRRTPIVDDLARCTYPTRHPAILNFSGARGTNNDRPSSAGFIRPAKSPVSVVTPAEKAGPSGRGADQRRAPGHGRFAGLLPGCRARFAIELGRTDAFHFGWRGFAREASLRLLGVDGHRARCSPA